MSSEPSEGFVTVVSGLPRSGTSLMMRMLQAGGMPVMTDAIRTADEDNPTGYFEFERVKALDKGDVAWLKDAEGQAVKVISALLQHLPLGRRYRVIFMNRRLPEVLASQRKMLERRGEPAGEVPDEKLTAVFERHVAKVKAWLSEQPNMVLLEVDYNQLVTDPGPGAARVAEFLGGGLDVERMAGAVELGLWRNR